MRTSCLAWATRGSCQVSRTRKQLSRHIPARERVNQLTNRAVRDRNFRKNVLRAYGERCAITGLRLINGGGRAEVEAAHIRPVEYDGPDIVSNGLALSGTAHWMFDRGLVGLADDLAIFGFPSEQRHRSRDVDD